MRKVIVLLTILVLVGSVLGLVCHCCPMSVAKPASTPLIAAQDCGCCPHATRWIERNPAVKENFEFLKISSTDQISYLAATASSPLEVSKFKSLSARFTEFGPPFSSSGIPLYLAENVLRL